MVGLTAWSITAVFVSLLSILFALPAIAQTTRPAIAGRRIVKHFDFNERPLGNYENTPMFWNRHAGQGFALFLEGRFDPAVYHAVAPSFRLDLNGSSVAYEYLGGDIAVRTRSDYLITAWIKTSGLDTARAYVSAYYLDRKKNPIPDTEVSSETIGGPGGSEEWQAVTIGLPGNVPAARYIGMTVWLAQERVWNHAPRSPRAIDSEDVQGTAWFDDITVYRLPRVTLTTANVGQAFPRDTDAVLLTEVSDPDGLNLSAKLTLRSEDGTVIDDRPVPLQPLDSVSPHSTVYKNLPMGIYRAELVVMAENLPLVRNELSFLRYPEMAGTPSDRGRGFGIVLRDLDPGGLNAQMDLLARLGVEYVKLPVWNPRQSGAGPTQRAVVEKYLEALAAVHSKPIGIMTNEYVSEPTGPHCLLDLLSGPAAAWKPLIATDWSQFAGLVYVWQIGPDSDESVGLDERLDKVTTALRTEMSALMSDPRLAAPSHVGHADRLARSADYSSLVLPASIPPDQIDEHLRPLIGDDRQHTWITVEPPAKNAYQREPRLADLARRLIEAAWQQPAAVFLDAPWDLRRDSALTRVDITEDYLVLRTVARLFGEAAPVSRFALDDRARCILFERNGSAVMLAWDAEAPPDGREYILPLGEQARQMDLWGRPMPVGRAGEQRTVRIGPMPSIIFNAPAWLLDFRHHFLVTPATVEANINPSQTQIVFRNTSSQPINGVLSLTGPPNWEIRPARLTFTLNGNEEFRQPITLRFPQNTPADLTPLVGEFELEADRRYRFTVPAWFEVGLKGIDLETFAYRKGDQATIRLTITNRSGSPVSFEAHLIAPDRERIDRVFTNFLPNQPLTKSFTLDKAAGLAGQRVRLTLKDLQGTRIWNQIITIP